MPHITKTKVSIQLNNKKIVPDLLVLSISQGDEAEWSSHDDNATVLFPDLDPTKPLHNGTPFTNGKRFEVPKNSTTGSSGPLMDKEKLQICTECTPTQYKKGHKKHYKYEIWSNGELKIDPEIIIVR